MNLTFWNRPTKIKTCRSFIDFSVSISQNEYRWIHWLPSILFFKTLIWTFPLNHQKKTKKTCAVQFIFSDYIQQINWCAYCSACQKSPFVFEVFEYAVFFSTFFIGLTDHTTTQIDLVEAQICGGVSIECRTRYTKTWISLWKISLGTYQQGWSKTGRKNRNKRFVGSNC